MNILVIGGTRFVGRHITRAFLAGGHSVTHFNRGITAPPPGSEVPTVHGDRAHGLSRVGPRAWDAIIDTSGYTPDVVQTSAQYFAELTARYVFISTISVYDEYRTTGPDEDAPLHALPEDADRTVLNYEYYGALKALCENVVISTYQHRATILRPGLIAGPDDPTDRFTYWPVRIDAGGDVLAPVSPQEPLQYIDVRDLAEFAVRTVETDNGGTYNCVTPRDSMHFRDLLQACARAAHSRPTFAFVDAEFLREHNVNPWSDMPLWIPQGDPHRGITSADSTRALAHGLSVRSLAETVRDTLEWARAAGKRAATLQAGLSPERERQLLNEYRARASLRR